MFARIHRRLVLLPILFLSSHAFARGSDKWITPATGVLDDLTAGLIKIGIPVVGIGIMALGIWAALSGRIDWSRAAMIVVGGILIAFGVDAIGTLLQ